MEFKMVKKVSNRWGCDFHRVPEINDIKVKRSLKKKIEESRDPKYRKIMNDRRLAAKFLAVKDPAEFNVEIRKTCELLGTSHRIDAVKIPKCEPKVDLTNGFQEQSSPVYEDDRYSCFGKRRAQYAYNECDFPTLGTMSERVDEIQTQQELQIKPEINGINEINEINENTVRPDKSMFKCLEISGLPASVKAEDLKTYLQDFGHVQDIQLVFEANGMTTALVWITSSACEWVISCLDDEVAVIKDLEVTLKVGYRNTM